MVKGRSITRVRENLTDCRVEYRKIDALNCSSIKRFDEDPVGFYNEFILKKMRKDSVKKVSFILGDLVDFYLLECDGDDTIFENRFDEKFALFTGKKGTKQSFILADELFLITQQSLNTKGEIVTSFMDRFKEAFYKVQEGGKNFKGKTIEYALQVFQDEAEDYFQMMIENSCKTVVEVSLVDKAKKIANLMTTDPFTSDLFNDKEMEYFPKFPIEWTYTTTDGKKIACKSELDIMRIDHRNKKVYLHDLKTTFDNEGFEGTYLRYRYDLQAAFYYLATQEWMNNNNLGSYNLERMEFIVGDTSSNNRRPVRFQTSMKDLEAGLNGFSIRGKYYKGIHQLIEEISWAEDNSMWNMSRELIESNGRTSLNIEYDSE